MRDRNSNDQLILSIANMLKSIEFMEFAVDPYSLKWDLSMLLAYLIAIRDQLGQKYLFDSMVKMKYQSFHSMGSFLKD